jgi:WD40 repeat protein
VGPKKGRAPEDARGPQVSQAFFFWSPPLTGERRRAPLLKKSIMSSGAVLCVVWAPDGSKLVSGGGNGDNEIKLWSPSTGECLNTLEGHR